MGWTRSALARMDSWSRQADVAIQRPVSRSHIIDRPTQPSICCIFGQTSSRM
jgi:hypothetical protein